jgi:hypothetical protein
MRLLLLAPSVQIKEHVFPALPPPPIESGGNIITVASLFLSPLLRTLRRDGEKSKTAAALFVRPVVPATTVHFDFGRTIIVMRLNSIQCAPPEGKTSSHFLKPLFAFLEVRAKSGLSHMMMVYTQATFPTFTCGLQKGHTVHFRYCAHFSTFPP